MNYFHGAHQSTCLQARHQEETVKPSSKPYDEAMEEKKLFYFTSHIRGENAVVTIYSDRIEWLKSQGPSAVKLTAGAATTGMSHLATGVRNWKTGTEMIPIDSISSVTTRRDGIINTVVSVITPGNTVDFRVSHQEAAIAKEILTRLILESRTSQNSQITPTSEPTVTSYPDIVRSLQKLEKLHDSGILTDDEFSREKWHLLDIFEMTISRKRINPAQ